MMRNTIKMNWLFAFSSVAALMVSSCVTAFAPAAHSSLSSVARVASPLLKSAERTLRTTPLSMMDGVIDVNAISSVVTDSSSTMLSFADQGQNLAGILFQSSLLPYLAFLYFLSFRGNRTPVLGNFGFQFLLLFVASTIPGGIISKSVYGCTLADVDWLHGGAEILLTVTNVLLVFGFREAMVTKSEEDRIENYTKPRIIAFGFFALFVAAAATLPSLLDAHSPFLFGLGNLPESTTTYLPWVTHSEPINALSIPTWAIHFSSVFEFVFAMNIIWNFAETTGNEKWKGMTWGMIPSHASGIAACTYHFFYNPSTFQFLVTTQAGLTLLGNITLAIAAYRIAVSNGWTFSELNPLSSSNGATSPQGIVVDNIAALPYETVPAKESIVDLAAKLTFLTIAASYIVKYGELGLNLPFEPNPIVASAIVGGVPCLTGYYFYNKSKQEGGSMPMLEMFGNSEDGEGKPVLSMAEVKKYGVAGTVAYILTELAFWAVAFPVASTALYQSTGHWPDVINDTTDRTTVLGFIFAGANVARLLVPLRLGAALALAPWVDENLLNRNEEEN